jgi:hypothetical protein
MKHALHASPERDVFPLSLKGIGNTLSSEKR